MLLQNHEQIYENLNNLQLSNNSLIKNEERKGFKQAFSQSKHQLST